MLAQGSTISGAAKPPGAVKQREEILRLGALEGAALPEALQTYLDCIGKEREGCYPGSARIAARLLRPHDRLVAIEKQTAEAAMLHASLAEFGNARAVVGDGYERLPALLPPRERRGIALIDPPYEAEDEFARAADALGRAYRRFATGIYIVWYPIKSRVAADAFGGEVRARGVAPLLRVEVEVGRAPEAARERLSAAGLLVVNAPFGFEREMRAAATVLAPLLGRTADRPAVVTFRMWAGPSGR